MVYRQSLSAVEYIVNVYGEENLHNIINDLAKGWSINRAFKNALGMGLSEFEKNWRYWVVQKEIDRDSNF